MISDPTTIQAIGDLRRKDAPVGAEHNRQAGVACGQPPRAAFMSTLGGSS